MKKLTIPRELKKRIDDTSARTGISRNDLFRNAVLYYFDMLKKKIDLHQELEAWEKASDIDLLNIESL